MKCSCRHVLMGVGSALLLAWITPAVAHADETETVAPNLRFDLVDGSTVWAKPVAREIEIQSDTFGKVRVPLLRVTRLNFLTNGVVELKMINGDQLQARLITRQFKATSLLGEVDIPCSSLKRVIVSAIVTPEILDHGLVLNLTVINRELRDASSNGAPIMNHGAEIIDPHTIRFGGQNSWIEIENRIGKTLQEGISVCAWIKRDGKNVNWVRIVTGGSPINSVFSVQALTGDTGILWRPVLSNLHPTAADLMHECDLSKWTFVVATYDGENAVLYINNEKVKSKDVAGRLAAGTGSIAVGGESGEHEGNGQASWWNGCIRSMRIYQRALTSEEVELLYRVDPPVE